MQIYFFIKYNSETTIEHILKLAKTDAVLCFDFEDSIYNWINPVNNAELKQNYRNYFKNIVNTIIPQISEIKIGLRINSNLDEIKKDIESISTLKINSILIPKVETPDQIKIIEQLLSENKVLFDELIPIIETPIGINNLTEIIDSVPSKISKIGFGHCDYNLSINAFPFFHQNNRVYWKWISKISSITIPDNITFLNSPFFELENFSFFESMLNYLHELFEDNVGQFTLTSKQSTFCKNYIYSKNKNSFINSLEERLNFNIQEQYLRQLINKFENENNNKGFTISKEDKILISPQEYITAKSIYNTRNLKKINFTFVGGCFPVQHNILFEDLFHQKLKKKIESTFNVNFNINIIRYERYNNCLNRIINDNESNPIDVLVFHIRPEPYLRLVKFYYKYVNNNGDRKYSFTIPFLKIIRPEKYDFLVLGRRYNVSTNQNNSQLHKALIDINYKTGNFLGNTKYALKKYFELVSDVINYCQNKNIKLILLGPTLRFETTFEPTLCNELNAYFKNKLGSTNVSYIDCIDNISKNHEQFFNSNGIHVNEKFHELIATSIQQELKRII